MDIKRYESNGRRSRVVEVGGMLYFCGQVSGEGEDITTQATNVFNTIDSLLETYGSDKAHVISAQIFLKDMADFEGMNAVWDSWVAPGNEPTRACVEAALAFPQFRIEVTLVAAKK